MKGVIIICLKEKQKLKTIAPGKNHEIRARVGRGRSKDSKCLLAYYNLPSVCDAFHIKHAALPNSTHWLCKKDKGKTDTIPNAVWSLHVGEKGMQMGHTFVSVSMDYLPNNVPEAHCTIWNDDGPGWKAEKAKIRIGVNCRNTSSGCVEHFKWR